MSSKIQRQLLAEEQAKKRAIRTANSIAYQERCRNRKLRNQPRWVQERNTQSKNRRQEAIRNNEFVIVVGGNKNKNKSQHTEDIPIKNTFDVLGETSDESDTEEEVELKSASQSSALSRKQVRPIVTTSNASATPGKNWASVATAPSSAGRNGFAKKNPPVSPIESDNEHFSSQTISMMWDEDGWDDWGEPETPDTPNPSMWERDSAMFNLDGTKKSWADLMDSDDEDF